MTDITLISEPYGSILFTPAVPCITIQWHSFANRQQFRSLMDRALVAYQTELAHHPRPLGWIADSRQLSALTPDDQNWCDTDWNPRAYAAGIRHIGIVIPESIFGKIAVQQYVTNVLHSDGYTFETRNFSSPQETKEWLQEVLPTTQP
ncbi:hypothetical protein [Hymenobacter cavernae]|uniref:STAS/SEC14 domain-containing protein n=1 Tax=Hymenobacter cavernae TaxID=2044852 RepID=A0ABQ1TRS3_9BACT|nr:hypothetical protein [Hymenobacter cavernae]GGF01825.1 hypothetical protein GCM10011383_10890 [Hymenobacter cavernae]